MNWDAVEARWKELTGSVRKHWGKLSEEDLQRIGGRRDDLSARLQQLYAIEKAEADRQIEDWMKEPGALDDWNDRRPILDM